MALDVLFFKNILSLCIHLFIFLKPFLTAFEIEGSGAFERRSFRRHAHADTRLGKVDYGANSRESW